ncbi:MAG: Gx transporter family protein [Firmicutes bacterium]|uniref:Gx transporter family protein n=1 Tax=Candidatus Scatoplasma merdavium TaxID=2840932 RepID=A0A9D9GS47_9BACL|nr:Gx transporter family protein [Candidatus Scatoplasma merdavium]
MTIYKMCLVAMLVAMGVGLHAIDSLINLSFIIPGFRIGLANVVSLFACFYLGVWYYPAISLVRCVLVGLIFTGFGTNFLLSLSGAIFSSFITVLLYYLTRASIYGISASGAFFHVLGQIITYIFIVDTPYMFLYLPLLSLFSIGSGLLLAICVSMIIKTLPPLSSIQKIRRGGRRKKE